MQKKYISKFSGNEVDELLSKIIDDSYIINNTETHIKKDVFNPVASDVLYDKFKDISTTFTAIQEQIKNIPINTPNILDEVIGIDDNGDVYLKKNNDKPRNFYTYGGISFGKPGEEDYINGITHLHALNDVSLSEDITNGESLVYENGYWINKTIQQGLDEQELAKYLYNNNYVQKDYVNEEIASQFDKFGIRLVSYTENDETKYYIESKYDFVVLGTISFGEKGNSDSGGTITEVTYDMVINALGYTPYDSTNPDEYITTDFANNTYASKTAISNLETTISNLKTDLDNLEINLDTLATGLNDAVEEINIIKDNYVDKNSNQSIIGIKTFENGFNIGEILISEKEKNEIKYIEIDGNLIVTGTISFGDIGLNDNTGGVTALFALTDVSLSEDITNGESLVYENGYWINKVISGTADSIAWDAITGKPTTLNGYGITDAYTAATIDSKLAGYLPITGGTINATSSVPLIIDTTSTSQNVTVYRLNGVNKGLVGYHSTYGTYLFNYNKLFSLGLKDDGTPYYYNGAFYPLLHSGNTNRTPAESVTVPFAGSFDSSIVTSDFTTSKTFLGTATDTDNKEWYTFISVRHRNGNGDGNLYGMLIRSNLTQKSDLIWRQQYNGTWYDWKTIIDSSNIGSQSVAYATNCGAIGGIGLDNLAIYSTAINANGNYHHIGYGYAAQGFSTSGPAMVFGSSNGYRLFLQAASSSHNVYVNYSSYDTTGVSSSWKRLALAEELSAYLPLTGGTLTGNLNVSYTNTKVSIEDNVGALGTGYSGLTFYKGGWHTGMIEASPLILNGISGGNVLIGTTTDSSAKLRVKGSIWSDALFLEENNASFTPLNVFGLYIWNNIVSFAKRSLDNVYLKEILSINLSTEVTQVTGNLTATGAITFGSDARYKTKTSEAVIDLETIANAPLFNYRWNDRDDNKEHLGTTAQYWNNTTFKNAVCSTNDEKLWTMSYSEISMGNSIIIARELIPIKNDVQILKERVNKLEKILKDNNIKFN